MKGSNLVFIIGFECENSLKTVFMLEFLTFLILWQGASYPPLCIDEKSVND